MFFICIYLLMITLVKADDNFECPDLQFSIRCFCDSEHMFCSYTSIYQVRELINSANAVERPINQVLPMLMLYQVEIRNFTSEILGNLLVKYINARFCEVAFIEEDAFIHLSDVLEKLVLTGNLLEEIPTPALEKLINLKSLNLNDNEIREIGPFAFQGLTSLVELQLSRNKIKEFSSLAFRGAGTSLRYLDLSKNQIRKFKGKALRNFTNLKMIDFNNNENYQMTFDDFQYIGNNLAHLELSSNNVNLLPKGVFSKLNSLKYLSLFNNKISELSDDAFQGIEDSLEHLKLSDNRLINIPTELLRRFDKLTHLELDGNKIINITKVYGKNLQFLHLDRNKIQTIEKDAFTELDSLKELYLEYNQLVYLHLETFRPILDTITRLDLYRNPLHCDCNTEWLVDLVYSPDNNSLKNILFKPNNTLCTTPREHKGKSVAYIKYDEIMCVSTRIENTILND